MKNPIKRLFINILFILLGHKISSINQRTAIQRILVLAYMGIGNMILFTPVLEALKKKYPNAKICILTGDNQCIDVIDGSPWIHEVIKFNFKQLFPISFLKLLHRIRREKYDLLMANFNSVRNYIPHFILFAGTKTQVVHEIQNEQYRWFFNKISHPVPYQNGLHEVEQNLNLIRALGETKLNKKPSIFIETDHRRFALDLQRKLGISKSDRIIALQPGSYEPMSWKRWPIESYAQLAKLLIRKHHTQIVILGSNSERSLAVELQEKIQLPVHLLVGETSIKQVAAFLERCTCLICNDSGMMHIGAAIGIPVFALYGPTNPRRTAPVGSNVTIIRKVIACSPCFIEFGSEKVEKCQNRICLSSLLPIDVFKNVINKIGLNK